MSCSLSVSLPGCLLTPLLGLEVRHQLVGPAADGGGAQVAGLGGDAGHPGQRLVVADGGLLSTRRCYNLTPHCQTQHNFTNTIHPRNNRGTRKVLGMMMELRPAQCQQSELKPQTANSKSPVIYYGLSVIGYSIESNGHI